MHVPKRTLFNTGSSEGSFNQQASPVGAPIASFDATDQHHQGSRSSPMQSSAAAAAVAPPPVIQRPIVVPAGAGNPPSTSRNLSHRVVTANSVAQANPSVSGTPSWRSPLVMQPVITVATPPDGSSTGVAAHILSAEQRARQSVVDEWESGFALMATCSSALSCAASARVGLMRERTQLQHKIKRLEEKGGSRPILALIQPESPIEAAIRRFAESVGDATGIDVTWALSARSDETKCIAAADVAMPLILSPTSEKSFAAAATLVSHLTNIQQKPPWFPPESTQSVSAETIAFLQPPNALNMRDDTLAAARVYFATVAIPFDAHLRSEKERLGAIVTNLIACGAPDSSTMTLLRAWVLCESCACTVASACLLAIVMRLTAAAPATLDAGTLRELVAATYTLCTTMPHGWQDFVRCEDTLFLAQLFFAVARLACAVPDAELPGFARLIWHLFPVVERRIVDCEPVALNLMWKLRRVNGDDALSRSCRLLSAQLERSFTSPGGAGGGATA